jgi:hypothetical protein
MFPVLLVPIVCNSLDLQGFVKICIDFHSVVGGHVTGWKFSSTKGEYFKKHNVYLCNCFIFSFMILGGFTSGIELFMKWHSFEPFFHPPTSLSISKHCYQQSNELYIKYEYKMLELRIKYRCSTHSNRSDWLKAIKKQWEGKTQIWPNLVLIWVSVPL